MKKNMISVVIMLLSVVTSVMAEAVRDETKETQTVQVLSTQTTQATPVEQRNKFLSQKAEEINKDLSAVAKDGTITKEEGNKLVELIRCFQKARKEVLAIYGENQVVKIDPKIEQIASLYTNPYLKDGNLYQPEIKRIIADLTNQDIFQVEKSFDWDAFGILIVLTTFCVLLLFMGLQYNIKCLISVGITGVMVFIAIIILGLSGC